MKLFAFALGAITLSSIMAGCGAAAGIQPSPTPSPIPSPAPSPVGVYPKARVLTDPSGPLMLKPGDQLVIVLSTQTGYQAWGGMSSDDLDVVAPLYPPVASSAGSTSIALIALGSGHTTLHSYSTLNCVPPSPLPSGVAYACPAIARTWSLDVTVAGGVRDPASIEFTIPYGPRTIHLLVGDQLTLAPGLTDASVSPSAAIVVRGRNPDGSQTLVAVAPGTAVLVASSDAPCLHSVPACMIAVMELRLQIVVRSA